jgi:hypothetical protein
MFADARADASGFDDQQLVLRLLQSAARSQKQRYLHRFSDAAPLDTRRRDR